MIDGRAILNWALALSIVASGIVCGAPLLQAQPVSESRSSPAPSADPREIARIVTAEMFAKSPSSKGIRLRCTSEWVCWLVRGPSFYEAYDPLTHKIQASANDIDIWRLFDGEDEQSAVLGRLARAAFPQDPVNQSTWIAEKVSAAEQRALTYALGMVGADEGGRAGGGVPISISAAPFAVEIRYRDSLKDKHAEFLLADPVKYGVRWQARHVCGGTLIAQDWVLTAAHCVNPRAVAGKLSVQIGVTDVSGNGGTGVDVDGAVVHADYNKGGNGGVDGPFDLTGDIFHNDIALLHLAPHTTPRDPKRIAAAALDFGQVGPGIEVEAVGWGRTRKVAEINNVTPVLQRVELQVLDNNSCMKMPGYGPDTRQTSRGGTFTVERVHAGVLCVKGAGQKTCDGDSGGPLFLSHLPANQARLVGIVSVNKVGCDVATDDRPGIYTRVGAYRDWIAKAMQNPPKPGETRHEPELQM